MITIRDQKTFSDARQLIALIQHGLQSRPCAPTRHVVARLAEQSLNETDFTAQAPMTLPVLAHFSACIAQVQQLDSALANQLNIVQPALKWQQSSGYSDDVLGAGFSANYGWAQLIGPKGFFAGEDFLLGVLMLGPHRHYLDHNHPAPELYWPLTSHSQWRREPASFMEKSAGEIIWHEPFQIHATKTFEQPMLAVWAWTKDVATPAKLI